MPVKTYQLDLQGEAVATKNSLAQSNGSATLAWNDAVIGDGKAKLAIPGDPYLSQGITFPKVQLGKVAGSVTIDKGKATLHNFRGHSKDLDIELEGYVELRDPISLSLVHAYLKFKPSDALVKREPTVELLTNVLGQAARRGDGYLGFSLTGTFATLLPLPSKDPPIGVSSGSSVANRPSAASPSTATLPPPSPSSAIGATHMGGLLPPPPSPVETPPTSPPVTDEPSNSPSPSPPPPPPSPIAPLQAAPANAIPPAVHLGAEESKRIEVEQIQ